MLERIRWEGGILWGKPSLEPSVECTMQAADDFSSSRISTRPNKPLTTIVKSKDTAHTKMTLKERKVPKSGTQRMGHTSVSWNSGNCSDTSVDRMCVTELCKG